MKTFIKLFFVTLFLLIFSATSSFAKSFNDNFDDGSTNKWWLGYSLALPSAYGNWRIESGVLVQDSGYDGVVALIKDRLFETQVVSAEVKVNGPSGSTGISLWFKDNSNGLYVSLGNEQLFVSEVINNNWATTYFPVSYNVNENRWANLKIEANNDNGEVKVYLDGVYRFTYNSLTTNRSGKTGLMTGNAGGYFDNFTLKSKIKE